MADENTKQTQEEEKPDELNLGSLSDEEINNLDPEQFEQQVTVPNDELNDELANAPPPDLNKEEEEEDTTNTEEEEKTEEEGDDETEQKEEEQEGEEENEEKLEDENKSEETQREDKSGEEQSSKDEIDYKAKWEQLTAKFKANGTEMNVNSVEEAIKLMQKGAGYTQTMQQNAPKLALAKVLENNGIDQTALNLLVDIHNKKPEAIRAMIKDSGIDTLDIDTENNEQYVATDHSVSQADMTLDTVISEIKGSEYYPKLTEYVTSQLDEPSKQVLRESPAALKQLHTQMELGVFDTIISEVNRRSALGTITGLTSLEAYRQVGAELHNQKAFDHLLNPNTSTDTTDSGEASKPAKSVIPEDKKKDVKTDKRKAATSGKTSTAKGKIDLSKTNPLSMSDEEFEKQFAEAIP